MIHSPHFTHIEAATPEQTQAREAAANAEWRKRLLMSHTPPSPIIKLNDLAIHIGPEPRIAQTGLPPKVNVEGSNEQSSTVREPTTSGLHIGPEPRIAQTGLPPKVGGEQEPSPVHQEPIWRYVHGTPDFRRPEPEPQPIVLPPRNENTTIPTPEPTPPGLRVEPQPIVRPPPMLRIGPGGVIFPSPPKELNEVKIGTFRLPVRREESKQENLVQDVLSVLNKTPIVTSPGVRVEPQPIVRPIENPPRSEPGSIPPGLRQTLELIPPGLRTELLPIMGGGRPEPIVSPPVRVTPPNVTLPSYNNNSPPI